jgi:hypothetical protein
VVPAVDPVAARAYEKALRENLPASAQSLVQQQAAKVKQAHDYVRDVRDRHTATTH